MAVKALKTIALVITVLTGCTRRGDVHVRLTRTSGPGAKPIENVTVFVGGSKVRMPWRSDTE